MNDNEIMNIIGKDKYIELLKNYNLCTKKWTYARWKPFYKEVKRLIKQKEKEKQHE